MRTRFFLHLFLSVALAASLAVRETRAAAGDLFVTEANSGTIFKFTAAGIKSTFASGLNAPIGLAFDRAGNLFVAEAGSGTILKLTSAGTKSIFASGLTRPLGLAFDSAGNLFVAEPCESDVGCGSIFKFSPDGTRSTFFFGANFALLAFGQSGDLFASTSGAVQSSAVFKFTSAGMKSLFADGLGSPAGLAFDSAGDLFVSDVSISRILRVPPDGGPRLFTSEVDRPAGLAFDAAGNLFEADADAILKFSPDGTKSTFASGLRPTLLAFEPVPEKLRNISARGFVQTGDNVLIGGFIAGGNALANNAVVIRAIGPSLSEAGIPDPLADPLLELHNSSGVVIASNDNWQDTQAAQITASGLAPANPKESAIFATLPAGNYTAVVRGAIGTTGVALVEVYSVGQ